MSTSRYQLPSLRDSHMELLRIVSIVMIVFSHIGHGDYLFTSGDWSALHVWIAILSLLGKIGVNIFVLISGYYLVAEKNSTFNPVKIVKFLAQCSFYSIGIFAVFAIVSRFSHRSLIWKYPVVFPVLFQLWWFATIYFWLFILHSWLNRLLRSLQKNEYQKLIVVLLISFCVIPSVVRVSYHAELLWFIILYVVAGYVRLHGEILLPKKKNGAGGCMLMSLVLFALMAGLRISGIVLEKRLPIFSSHTISLGEMHNVFSFLIAVYLFQAFLKLKIGYHIWINFLAATTFGVYLIHEHPAVRRWLWSYFFLTDDMQNIVGIVLYSVMAVATIYFVCAAIDTMRKYCFERPFLALLNHIFPRLQGGTHRLYGFMRSIIFGK